MTKLEEIAMRESPLLKAMKREEAKTAVSFADQFLAMCYGCPRQPVAVVPSDTVEVSGFALDPDTVWLQRVQAETDRQVAAYGEQLSRYLLCKVSPADMVIAKHVAPRCECGSGSDDPSGAHSHWCKLWVAP